MVLERTDRYGLAFLPEFSDGQNPAHQSRAAPRSSDRARIESGCHRESSTGPAAWRADYVACHAGPALRLKKVCSSPRASRRLPFRQLDLLAARESLERSGYRLRAVSVV